MTSPSPAADIGSVTLLLRDLLQHPRESGTPEGDQARDQVADFLARQGYQVETQRFSFSTSALMGFPVLGAGLGWLTLLLIPLLVLPTVPAWIALLVWGTGLVSLVTVAAGLSLGWATLGGDMREDANLIATRGGRVTRWIVAHYDTKAQGHSMAGRLVAVWVLVVAGLLMTGLAIIRLWGPLPTWVMAAGAASMLAGGYLAGRGRLKGKSAGARDNGSGLLAALVAAQEIKDPSVGILVTGAEEFGLIGSRYFVERSADRLAGTDVVNIDTVDEQGTWRVVRHLPNAAALAGRMAVALGRHSSLPLKQHRLPAGIFVDSLPLARAGARAITIARLNWGTLARIHTPRDTLEGLSLDSAVLAGFAIAGMIGER